MYNIRTIDNGFIVDGDATLDELEMVINDALSSAIAGRRKRLVFEDFFINLNLAGGKVPNFFYAIFKFDSYVDDYAYCVRDVNRHNIISTIKQMMDDGYEYMSCIQTGQVNFIVLFRKLQ